MPNTTHKGFKVSHGPIEDAYYYGRENMLKSLRRNLRDGQNTVFIGHRQMGKTALAFKSIERNAASLNLDVAHVDLWEIGSFRQAGEMLLNDYMRRYFEINLFTKSILAGVANMVTQLTKKLGTDIEESIDRALHSLNSESGGDYLVKSFELIIILAHYRQKRVVLFIDEFQELSKFNDIAVSDIDVDAEGKKLLPGQIVFKRLRTLLQKEQSKKHAVLYAAGSEATLMKKIFGKSSEAFMQGAVNVYVEPIENHEYQSHFKDVCEYEDCEFSGSVAELFYYLSGGIPYYLSSFSKRYVELFVDEQKNVKDAAMEAVAYVIKKEEPFLKEKIVDLKKMSKHSMLFYTKLHLDHPKTQTAKEVNIRPQSLDGMTERMIEDGFIFRDGSEKYQPTLPLLFFYARMDSYQRSKFPHHAVTYALEAQEKPLDVHLLEMRK